MNSPISRVTVLESLLNFDKPMEEIVSRLTQFDWDSDELVILKIAHIKRILERFVSGEFDETVVEEWANVVECRDDIELSKRNKNILEELVYELANPTLTKKLTPKHAKFLLGKLAKTEQS